MSENVRGPILPSTRVHMWINVERFHQHGRHYNSHIKTCKAHMYGAYEGWVSHTLNMLPILKDQKTNFISMLLQ